jgi:hypothetical protein
MGAVWKSLNKHTQSLGDYFNSKTSAKMMTLLYKLLQRRGIFFYLLFIVYLLYLHPLVIGRLSGAGMENPDPLMGWIVLLIPFAELLGFWLKYPIMLYYAREYPAKEGNWQIILIVFLPILHLGMSTFIFIVGTQTAGLQPAGDAAWYWQLLYVAGFFVVIFKELGFLALFFSLKGVKGSFAQQYPPEIRLGHLFRDAAGDILLLLYSAMGYTILWEFLGKRSSFDAGAGFWGSIMQYLGILIYFVMVIPPLQAIYTLQNSITQRTKIQRIWSAVSFLIVLVIAVRSIVQG